MADTQSGVVSGAGDQTESGGYGTTETKKAVRGGFSAPSGPSGEQRLTGSSAEEAAESVGRGKRASGGNPQPSLPQQESQETRGACACPQRVTNVCWYSLPF